LHQLCAGKDWNLDNDVANTPPETGATYLTMLAIDCMLAVVASIETLADASLDGLPLVTGRSGGHDVCFLSLCQPPCRAMFQSYADALGAFCVLATGKDVVEVTTPVGMIGTTWHVVLASLSQLLARCNSEALMLQVLRGFQSFTQACGLLALDEPRDAFLSTLCDFALSLPGDDVEVPSLETGEDVMARPPSLAKVGGQPMPRGKVPEGLVLSSRNVQTLRTLFNIAHRLDHVLGPAWVLILGTLNSLDSILNSPRTTTQVWPSRCLCMQPQACGLEGHRV
jgi:hypothetical protein